MKSLFFMVVVAAALSGALGNVRAGTIEVDTRCFPDLNGCPEIIFRSDRFVFKRINQSWDIETADSSLLYSRVDIIIHSPNESYRSFEYSFDIPYYWSTGVHTLAAGSAFQGKTEEDVGAFVQDMGGGQFEVRDIMLAHVRASILWQARIEQLKNKVRIKPSADDIRVTYWLLRTMKELMLRTFMLNDQTSDDASTWINGVIAKASDSDSRRLFTRTSASIAEFKEILKTLSARTPFLFNSIVQKLQSDVKMHPEATCLRVDNLSNYFSYLDRPDLASQDGQFPTSAQVTTLQVFCKTIALRDGIDRPKTADTLAAEAVAENAANVLKSSVTNRFPAAARNLRNATKDLTSILK